MGTLIVNNFKFLDQKYLENNVHFLDCKECASFLDGVPLPYPHVFVFYNGFHPFVSKTKIKEHLYLLI